MWRLEKYKASLRNPTFTCQLDVQSPEAGLSRFKLAGKPWLGANPWKIHSFDPDQTGQARCDDLYLRGPDLVASYRMSKMPEFSWQVYWRALTLDIEDKTLHGIELILSVQTDLLDCDPRLKVASQVTAEQLLQIKHGNSPSGEAAFVDLCGASAPAILEAPALLIYRPPNDAYSYLEMVHPADFGNVKVSGEQSKPSKLLSQYHLFDAPLEKGVIRRARLRSMIIARTDDVATAQACYQRFEGSAIPLTA